MDGKVLDEEPRDPQIEQIPMVDEEGEEDTEEEEGAAGGGGGDHHRDHQENPSFSPIRSGVDGIPGESGSQTSFLLDSDLTPEEQEEKARLIAQVLELQNTLDDLSSRVDNVKEENLRLRSENQVLGQYIENLMAASSVFQPANDQPNKSSRRK